MSSPDLRLLLDHAPGLLGAFDEDYRCRFLNDRGAAWLGVDAGRASGLSVSELFGSRVGAWLIERFDGLKTGPPSVAEIELPDLAEGRRVRCTLTATASGPMLSMEDLSDRVELERQLASHAEQLDRSHESFKTIIEQSPDGIFVHRAGRVVYVNPSRVRMMGYDRPEELLGRSLADLVHPDDRAGVLAHIAAMETNTEEPRHRLGRLYRKDGTSIEVEVIALPITFEGEPALLSSARDMSERRQLIARMMEADRMITAGTLAAGMGHEINNPLAYLLGNLEFVLEGLESDGKGSEFAAALEAARDGALRIQQVTRDLRALARAEERDPAPVNVVEAIESALNMASREIHHRARLVLDLTPTPTIQGDVARLGQLMVNLLVNAAHAIEEGDAEGNEIRVRSYLERRTRQVVVEVSDTGSGIPEEVREHLFDPFVTTKPMSQGTGLGLAICRQIVDAHGGEISFESVRGRGTTFRVVFPAFGEAPIPVRVEQSSATGRARVLVIDDDALLVDAFVRVLRKEHEVVAFTSSREALEHLNTVDPYHVILCDLMMPELSGMEVFAEAVKRNPEVASRFLFMTGGAFTPRAQQFVQENRERTIDKPIRVSKLRQLVTQHAFERGV